MKRLFRDDGTRVDPWEMLWREVDRCRRHRHSFALVRLTPLAAGPAERRALPAALGALRGMVRSVDSVWVDHHGIFMLLPESDRAGAEGLLRRVAAAGPAVVSTDEARIACFPEDGLTANALRAAVGRSEARPPSLPVGPSPVAFEAEAAPARRARRAAGRRK